MTIYCAPLSGSDGSLAVYSLLRYAFNIEYGGEFPEIKKTPNGKPYFPARRDIHFSLSHSRTHVLCALSGEPVGADIESPRLISERAIKFFCSPAELALFDPLDIWVLKESYIKLVGETLAMIKKPQFSRCGDSIIAPDIGELGGFGGKISPDFGELGGFEGKIFPDIGEHSRVISRLYRIEDCRAAVCSLVEKPPDSVELVIGSDCLLLGSADISY